MGVDRVTKCLASRDSKIWHALRGQLLPRLVCLHLGRLSILCEGTHVATFLLFLCVSQAS